MSRNQTPSELLAECERLRQALAQAQRTLAEQARRIAQLEAQLARATKDSSNSSKPSSSDVVKARGKKRRSGRKIGGQPGHKRHERPAFTPEQIDLTQIYQPHACEKCGCRDFLGLPETRRVVQQVELVQKPFLVTEHVTKARVCNRCQHITEGSLPEPVLRLGLIGARFMALLLFLKGPRPGSYSGLQEFLADVLGLTVSRGFLAKLMTKGAEALAKPVEALLELLPVTPGLNVDETGHKENGKRLWTWCFRAKDFVLFRIEESRGSDVLIEVLGLEFQGVLGCDYFSAYRKYMGLVPAKVQFCLAHLIRDLKFLADHPDPGIQLYGKPILQAVGTLFKLIHQQAEQTEKGFAPKLERCKGRIIELAGDLSVISPIEAYVRRAHPEVHNMAERFRKHGESYFTFLTTPGIDPTNNAAEQAIRFVVIDRHITQGTRSPKGRRFCERIWTVVATCRVQKRSIFRFLHQAILAWAHKITPPSLLPVDSS